MSNDHKKSPGGHYSGNNPIPNIQRFIASLDADKKLCDEKIHGEMQAKAGQGEATDHKPQKAGVNDTRKTVTDPTTRMKVNIEDVNKGFMKSVETPYVGTFESLLKK